MVHINHPVFFPSSSPLSLFSSVDLFSTRARPLPEARCLCPPGGGGSGRGAWGTGRPVSPPPPAPGFSACDPWAARTAVQVIVTFMSHPKEGFLSVFRAVLLFDGC